VSDSPVPSPAEEQVPERFRVDLTGLTLLGVYRVERKLAEGGMGAIYLAEDTNLGFPVVVKVPHARFLAEPGFRARLAREVSELVKLEHPGVVRILARGEVEDIPFFVLQYLGGGSLEDRLAGGKRETPEEVLGWLPAMAGTLDFVHRRGSLHRDVKPGNVLFDEEGHVFLSDFGVAKAVEGEGSDEALTGTGVGIGSPRYMAPEQGLGHDVGPRADLYGLGSTVFEALTGRPPFGNGSAVEILVRKAREEAPDPREHAPDVPPAVAAAVRQAMARDIRMRFETCTAFADAFAHAVRPPPKRTPPRSPWRQVIVTALLTLAIAVALVWILGKGDGEAPRTDLPPVKLIDAGREPRRALRYAIAPDAREEIVMGVVRDREVTIAGFGEFRMDDPRLELHAEAIVEGLDARGDLRFRWVVRKALATQDVDDSPPRELDSVDGITIRGLASPQGLVHDLRVENEASLDAVRRSVLDALRWSAREVCIPLPREPVGVGARWEVTRPTSQLSMDMSETTIYELESLEGDRLELRLTSAVTAPEQTLTLGGRLEEIETRLTSFHGQGAGRIRVDLDRLVPDGLDFRMEGRLESESKINEQSGTLDATFLYDVEIGRR